MNKEFLKAHFIDDDSMEDYQATLNEANELQSRINNGDFNYLMIQKSCLICTNI
jgi:hypothetical protein